MKNYVNLIVKKLIKLRVYVMSTYMPTSYIFLQSKVHTYVCTNGSGQLFRKCRRINVCIIKYDIDIELLDSYYYNTTCLYFSFLYKLMFSKQLSTYTYPGTLVTIDRATDHDFDSAPSLITITDRYSWGTFCYCTYIIMQWKSYALLVYRYNTES